MLRTGPIKTLLRLKSGLALSLQTRAVCPISSTRSFSNNDHSKSGSQNASGVFGGLDGKAQDALVGLGITAGEQTFALMKALRELYQDDSRDEEEEVLGCSPGDGPQRSSASAGEPDETNRKVSREEDEATVQGLLRANHFLQLTRLQIYEQLLADCSNEAQRQTLTKLAES